MNKLDFDIIIVGGGISGIGILAKAKELGYRCLLIEKNQLSELTSNNSLRIIHGGLRYFQQLNLIRVIESIKAQAELKQKFPEDIKTLECLMPLDAFGACSKYPIKIISKLYQFLYQKITTQKSKTYYLNAKRSEVSEKLLFDSAPNGCLVWQDALIQDPIKFANNYLNYYQVPNSQIQTGEAVIEIKRIDGGFSCKTEKNEYQSKIVVNACGPDLNRIKLIDCETLFNPNWCLAFNLVLKHKLLKSHALAFKSKSGRRFFMVPRDEHTALGTFYYPIDQQHPLVKKEMLDEAIIDFNSSCKNFQIDPGKIFKIESGILPIKDFYNKEPRFIGSTKIHNDSGFISILSTKYTSFEIAAKQVLKIISKILTNSMP